MKLKLKPEEYLLWGHGLAMAFGLAGLLLVLPNADFIASLPEFGKVAFRLSMANGGVMYMLLGMAAVTVYAYRLLEKRYLFSFLIPALTISVSAELLGTSTGFPFGAYHYTSGLGYKIAGLVPFTIPLSWFYLGFSSFLIARVGLQRYNLPRWIYSVVAIALGALLLTSWDFVLDPGMSQTAVPFWEWEVVGPFFGMPYENFSGWFGTGAIFMGIASFFWGQQPLKLSREQLQLPFMMYLFNFTFATMMSIGGGIYPPIFLGILLGLVPVIALYFSIPKANDMTMTIPVMDGATTSIPVGAGR
ncbi:gamma-carotene 1'-hydroxylase CruF [Picosynechococcus sp. NKBG15041c]|uniref:gamma-carotene 1'-hydroxylase CruF n=1 Tax=Picosynechococcus sp. NKBG15041c TaxID=1407650 RepID=UPI000413675D|nr:carotenoid biosynthesis protein [Picosynechococcus sp. NKBG15041c]